MVVRDMYKVIVQYWCKQVSAYECFVESVEFSTAVLSPEYARRKARERVLILLAGDPQWEGEPISGAFVERSDYGASD